MEVAYRNRAKFAESVSIRISAAYRAEFKDQDQGWPGRNRCHGTFPDFVSTEELGMGMKAGL